MSINENNYYKKPSFIELGCQQEQDVLSRYSNPYFLNSFSNVIFPPLFNISTFDFTKFPASFAKVYADFDFGTDYTWDFSQKPRYSDIFGGINNDSFSIQTKSEYKSVTTSAKASAKTNKDTFVFNKRVTSDYGPRKHPVTGEYLFHSGVDYSFYEGESICSPIDGVVEKISQDNISGKYVVVKSSDGARHLFCHCSDTSLLKVGDNVSKNTVVALAGSTGRATGSHLHYEIKMNGKSVNPQEYYA